MKIIWFCIPAHGHTNPTLGIVRALTGAGHTVYYFSYEMFREKIEGVGATFFPCDDYNFEEQDADFAEKFGKDQSFAVKLMVSATIGLDGMVSEKIKELQPDLIVSDSVAFWGKLASMKFGLPYICSTTTFAFNRYSGKYNSHGIGETLRMLLAMPEVNRQIKRLRDKGYPVKGILDIVTNDNDTNTIVYTSKYYQPCAETFSDRYHFIGPSIRPITQKYEKTAEKTVYISMGTVNNNREFYRNCIEVLGKTDYQVIISMGTNPDHFDNLPSNIQIYESVDQMAVLSIADAFITHCGMNSASEGLYFGVPLILFPQTPEQGAVAKRTAELGAGLKLPSIKQQDILKCLTRVLEEPGFKEGAGKVSESFKNAGGIEEAVAFIERIGNKQ
ncbi:macrolide family glycosyltransferase [Butyrivibrio sp. MC2021]|uniref:macrolide family glycosyltransferase n=1 Tax=Butyrivibrio sp. MC2021 TaxID=1408306 RepID=UPI000478E8A9|nr:macrolide family glycosyltransferase [Butyrivibrio sp. MC2021]